MSDLIELRKQLEDQLARIGNQQIEAGLRFVFDTIEQQQAEIERLREALEIEQNAYDLLAKDHAKLQAEIERLTETAKNYAAAAMAKQQENAKLEKAIRWALGECPEGTPDFPVMTTRPPYYRWRTTLRMLAELPAKDCNQA